MSNLAGGNGDPIEAPQHKPVCPKCETELDEFAEAQVTFKNGLIAHMLWCPNTVCRALFAVQIMGMAQQPKGPQRIIPSTLLPRLNPRKS